jgi:hypothetical protein
MLLYEPKEARRLGLRHYGSDPIEIVYPAVNSCVTYTYFFSSGLVVGAHFALQEPGEAAFVRYSSIISALGFMHALSPGKPDQVLLIGCMDLWESIATWEGAACSGADRIALLRKDAFGKLGRNPIERETADHGSVDVEVYTTGVVTIKKSDGGKEIETFFVKGALRPLASAARARLGI